MLHRLILVAWAVVLLAACAAYKGVPARLVVPDAMPASTAGAPLFLAADPYGDKGRQKAVFDADLTDKRVVAIDVLLENRGERELALRRASIALELADGTVIPAAQALNVVAKLGSSGDSIAWGLGFGIIGFAVASSREQEEQSARRADYQSKEFPPETKLAKGESVRGFVYFMPPRGTPAFSEASLTVPFFDAGAEASIRLPLTGLAFRGW